MFPISATQPDPPPGATTPAACRPLPARGSWSSDQVSPLPPVAWRQTQLLSLTSEASGMTGISQPCLVPTACITSSPAGSASPSQDPASRRPATCTPSVLGPQGQPTASLGGAFPFLLPPSSSGLRTFTEALHPHRRPGCLPRTPRAAPRALARGAMGVSIIPCRAGTPAPPTGSPAALPCPPCHTSQSLGLPPR